MGARIINNVINQLGAPSIFESALASFPAAGQPGRLLVATDTFALYRDNGTGFDLIGGPGTGTITGSGTVGKISKFTGAAVIGNSIMAETTGMITVTGGITVTAAIVNGSADVGGGTNSPYLRITSSSSTDSKLIFNGAGVGADYTRIVGNQGGTNNSNITFFTENILALTISKTQTVTAVSSITATSFIVSGGLSTQFLKADGSLDANVYTTASSVTTFTNKSGDISQWTNNSGYLTAAGAVISITGTADQVIASAATGAVTLSLPQSIATTSDVIFGKITANTNLIVNGNGLALNQIRITHSGAGTNGVLDLGVTDVKAFVVANYLTTAIPFAILTGAAERFNITATGITNVLSRLNVNGAADNANFQLNVSGCIYTNSFSPTASTKTASWTAGDNTTYIFTGAAGQTATMENPATTNKIVIIKNFSGNSLTVAGFSANSIIDNTNTAVSNFTLTTGKTVIMQQDGGSKTIILSIY